MSVEYVEKLYNLYSGAYDVVWGWCFQGGRVRAPEFLELSPGTKLLEVGIGTGATLPLLPRDIDITGIDLSEGMLSQARKRAAKMGLTNVKFMHMDATKMDLPDNSFDRVLAAYFITTVPDPVAVVEEMKRVCRPGGRLVFMNHFLSQNKFLAFLEKLISPLCYRIGFHTDLDLHKLMDDCGLEIDALESIDFLCHWKAVRCIVRK